MCKCTPEIKTPFCGKPNCEWPEQVKQQARENAIALSVRIIRALDEVAQVFDCTREQARVIIFDGLVQSMVNEYGAEATLGQFRQSLRKIAAGLESDGITFFNYSRGVTNG